MLQRVGVGPTGDILDIIKSWPAEEQKRAHAAIEEIEDQALKDMQVCLVCGTHIVQQGHRRQKLVFVLADVRKAAQLSAQRRADVCAMAAGRKAQRGRTISLMLSGRGAQRAHAAAEGKRQTANPAPPWPRVQGAARHH